MVGHPKEHPAKLQAPNPFLEPIPGLPVEIPNLVAPNPCLLQSSFITLGDGDIWHPKRGTQEMLPPFGGCSYPS